MPIFHLEPADTADDRRNAALAFELASIRARIDALEKIVGDSRLPWLV